ncbi:MAG: phage holin family protein [Planctomycetes bacterium]|nr:phage holin family protein [Planctomycetota bacterium]
MIDSNNNPRNMFPPQAVAHNVNELKHDVVTLIRLQFELFTADVRETGRRLRAPGLLLACAIVLALGAVPVVLFALAAGLQILGLSPSLSLGIVGVGGLIVAAGVAAYAWQRFRAAAAVMERSREELRRNVESLKELFLQDWSLHRESTPNHHD